jgi:hypothetical protein
MPRLTGRDPHQLAAGPRPGARLARRDAFAEGVGPDAVQGGGPGVALPRLGGSCAHLILLVSTDTAAEARFARYARAAARSRGAPLPLLLTAEWRYRRSGWGSAGAGGD